MKLVSTETIRIGDIDDGTSLRPLNQDWVNHFAVEIAEKGFTTAIHVAKQKKKGKPSYRLVAGRHRKAAVEQIDGTEILAAIFVTETDNPETEIRLYEIDENLHSYGLNPLDRAVFIGERERIYKELHPEAARGGDRKSAEAKDADQKLIFSFRSETAEKIGLTVSTVKRATDIYSRLTEDVRDLLVGTPIAAKEGELYSLTRFSEDQQKQIIAACTREDSPAPSVSVAKQEFDGRAIDAKTPEEKALAALKGKFTAAPHETKVLFMYWLLELGVIDGFDRGQIA